MKEEMGEKIEKIQKIEQLDPKAKTDAVAQSQELIDSPEKTKFDAAISKADLNWQINQATQLQAAQIQETEQVTATKKTSLIDEISQSQQKIQQLQPASIDQITAQAEDLRGAIKPKIEQIQSTLADNPDTKIRPDYEAQLSSKLIHIDTSLKAAVSKVGNEVSASQIEGVGTGQQAPLVKFLNYLTTSDQKLQHLVSDIKGLDVEHKQLTAGQMLTLQIKLGFVQQELEFFSNVLNKALEAVKTTMNVQI